MDVHAYLTHLMADIATAPAVDTRVRHDLLADVLAPLGVREADRLFSGEVDVAAHLAACALGQVSA